MTRLAITVALRDGEAPSSFLSRLARANGEETMRAFAFHVGLDARSVLRGDSLALTRFADLAGCGADALASWAPTAVAGKVRLRGECLGAGKVLRCGRILACPWCIAEDIADETLEIGLRPWIRTTWLIQWIRTCGRHQQSLVEVAATDKPQLLHDASALLFPRLPELAALAAGSRSRPPSLLETYIEGRLKGTASAMAPLVDPMPLYAVARLSERIGAVRLAGPRVRLEAFDEDDFYEAGHLGFEVLAGGAERLRGILSDLQGAFHDGSADWGLRILFGALHDFVASSRDPAFDSVRNIIHEHIIETMPVGPGEIVLGRRVKVRRFHSIRSASLEHGVDPRRLRKYLRRQGILSPSQDHLTDERTVFPALEADEALRRYEEGVSLREAGRYLNAPRPHERLLLEAGYIRPLETGAPPGTLHTRRFPRSALDEFLRCLSAKAGPDFQGSHDIPSAAKRTTRSAMEIVELLLQGRLERVGVDPNARGYLSVKVDVYEVRTHLPRDAPEGMTLREAERALSTSTDVIRALVQGELLPTRSVRNAVNRNVQTIVAPEDLADFQARYVSLTTLARELKVHFRKLPNLLAQNGIHPDPAFAEVPATFYRRQNLSQLRLS